MSTYENQTGKLAPQSLLQQRYLIVKQIGRGNMGAVYQAQDTHIANRQVAIKELSQSHLSEEKQAEAVAQFQREAATLRALSHPNLSKVYESFSDHGRSYLVLDFIEGKTFLQLLKEADGRPFPVVQVLNYGCQLCDVLSYLHNHHPPFIFRDLKPTNVMVTQDGHVFLIDFGIARIFKESQQKDTVFLGSPGYAAPEQYGTSQTNPRSDLYSLGATLHYCLTGRDPYYASERFSFPPVHEYNPQIPIELDRLIQRLVTRNQEERPASAAEVKRELVRINQQITASTQISTLPQAPVQQMSPAPASTPNNNSPPPIAPTIPGNLPSPALVTSRISPTLPSLPVPASNASPPTPVLSQAGSTPPSPSTNNPSSSPSIWRPGFFILFGLSLVLAISGSAVGITAICNSYHLVESVLSVLLLLAAATAGLMVGSLIPRSLFFSTALFTLIASLAFITQSLTDKIRVTGDSSTCPAPALNAFPHVLSLVLTFGLVAAAVLSLAWLLRPFARIDRAVLLVVFGIALSCAAFQAFLEDGQLAKHILLMIALIALFQGVLLVIQMERVRRGT